MIENETDLILLAQKGNNKAFEQLVKMHDKKVYALALHFTGSDDDAKDVYQEVFIRVFKSLKSFEQKSQFSTWLHRITVNVCLTYKTREARHNHIPLETEEDELSPINTLADNSLSPEREVESGDIGEHIQECIGKLPEKQRMAFLMKHTQGLKFREIAERMGCEEGTVKRYVFTATQKLKNDVSLKRRWQQ